VLLRPLLNVCSPAGAGGRLSILLLHRVLPEEDPLLQGEFHASRFDAVCGWLRDWFVVLPLDEAIVRLRDGTLPARAAAITFDDGYADNHDVALPILRRHRLPATIFIATGYLDGGRMFNDTVIETVRRAAGPALDLRRSVLGDLGVQDLSSLDARRRAIDALLPLLKPQPLALREAFCAELQRRAGVAALPDDLMMTSEQVLALRRGGVGIGAHTADHPILAELDDSAAREQIERGRDTLRDLLGERVSLFAYPNGRPGRDYSAASVALVRDAGFDAAFSTGWGAARRDSDLFQLPRFTPWDRSRTRFGLRMVANLRRSSDAIATIPTRPLRAAA